MPGWAVRRGMLCGKSIPKTPLAQRWPIFTARWRGKEKGRQYKQPVDLFFWGGKIWKLAFRELETFASSGLAGLFALLHSRIPSQEAFFFQDGTKFGIRFDEDPGNGKSHRARLPTHATTIGAHTEIKCVHAIGEFERAKDVILQRQAWEVVDEIAVIDRDRPRAGLGPDFGNRVFTTPGGGLLNNSTHGISWRLFNSHRFWCLGFVGMGLTAIHFEFAVGRGSKAVVRDHPLDGALDEEFRAALLPGFECF